jgi:DtxR family transcriptional regulator, Mn-dependent transcriptional regulator
METWKEFEANELTHSAAHHLAAIHELGAQYGGWARVSDVARKLGITRGSVSINLRALKRRGLVLSDEHRMVRLSPHGAKSVQAVHAHKEILKRFLTEVAGLPEPQAEIDSCKIEHLVSRDTARALLRLQQFVAAEKRRDPAWAKRARQFASPCPRGADCGVCTDRCWEKDLAHE